MESVAVCLYSKYSQRSKEFLDDIHPDMGIQMLCIDNEEVRQALLKDTHGYHIKTVPCVFVFHSNGRLEKYEGSDAFTWLRKTREVLEAKMFQQQQQQPQQTPIQFQQSPPRQTPIQLQPPTPPQQPPIQLQPVPLEELPPASFEPPSPYEQVNNEPLDITPIDENGIQSLQQNLPPQQTAEDMMNQEMELRRASDQIMTRKQDNIKELAQMMQRQRERDDDKIAPPPLYPQDQQNNRPPF